MVLRSALHPELRERLRAALLSIVPDSARLGLERFAPVTYEHYATEEKALRECENTLGTQLR